MTRHLAALAATALGVAEVATPRVRSRFEQASSSGRDPRTGIVEETVEKTSEVPHPTARTARGAPVRRLEAAGRPTQPTPAVVTPRGVEVTGRNESTPAPAERRGRSGLAHPAEERPVPSKADPRPSSVQSLGEQLPRPSVPGSVRAPEALAPAATGREDDQAGRQSQRSAAAEVPDPVGVLLPAPLTAAPAPPPPEPAVSPGTSPDTSGATTPVPDVHVTIGRLEVRVRPGPEERRTATRAPQGLRSLDDYGAARGLTGSGGQR